MLGNERSVWTISYIQEHKIVTFADFEALNDGKEPTERICDGLEETLQVGIANDACFLETLYLVHLPKSSLLAWGSFVART